MSEKQKAMQAYLAKYTTGSDTKKKKKKKRSGNVNIIDANSGGIPNTWSVNEQHSVDGADEEAPLVVNAEELEREHLLESRKAIKKSQQTWQTISVRYTCVCLFIYTSAS